MKFLIKTVLLSMFLSQLVFAAEEISTKEAPFYTGKDVVACGVLQEVARFKRGLYLNMDNKYPKQSLTFIVWEDDINKFNQKFNGVESLVGQNLCGKGRVNEYKGRSQISLYNSYSLVIQK